MSGLTQKQKSVLYFIDGYIRSNSLSPALTDISSAFGWSTTTAAYNHVKALESKGYIARERNKARTIQVLRLPSRGGEAK